MAVMLSILMILLLSLYKLSKQKKTAPEHKYSGSKHKYNTVIFVIFLLAIFSFVCYFLVQKAKDKNAELFESFQAGSLSE
jgi:hypothetical protein